MSIKRIRRSILPKPKEMNISGQRRTCSVQFKAGYEHGLRSNILINFKYSFMMGFRRAKLELAQKSRVRSLPRKIKFRV